MNNRVFPELEATVTIASTNLMNIQKSANVQAKLGAIVSTCWTSSPKFLDVPAMGAIVSKRCQSSPTSLDVQAM